jgi:hypothetical protein
VSPEPSIEPSIEPSGNKYNAPVVRPSDVTEQVWADFLALRKEKRSKLTETALRGIRNAAAKAGFSMQAALELCCERGWQSFRAEWLAGKGGAVLQPGAAPSVGKFEALRERNRRAAQQWLDQSNGASDASE